MVSEKLLSSISKSNRNYKTYKKDSTIEEESNS